VKFSEIQLHPILQANLDKMQFVECTQIQEQGIPWIRKGKDVAGLAQTGTGKTGAFLIPLIDRLLKAVKPDDSVADSETVAFNEWKKKQYVLVLVPTRELAEQVYETAKKFLAGTGFETTSVYGGTTYERQTAALKDGVEFVIATPGRFIDLFKEHIADLALVRAVVFDEADRMFDMGFKDDMKFILRRIPRDRQFMVFSATLNFDVLNVAYEYGAEPVEISISRDQPKAENVTDHILHLGQEDKPRYLLSLLKKIEPRQTIIFSNFKHNVERLSRFLNSNGVPTVGISSLLTQAQRNRVMEQFKAENDRNILVATDLAARGLDILGVDLVVNYELPDDPENYVHRIGRTGRAGQTGQAYSMVSDRDVDALQRIEEYLKHKIENIWLDDAELVKEFQPYPRDEQRSRGPRPGGGRGQERDRGGGGRGGGGRDRDRDRGPRRDRPPRGEHPNAQQGQPREGQGAGRGEQHPRRDRHQTARSGQQGQGGGHRQETHRDRQSGRHLTSANGNPQQSQQQGGGQRRHQGDRDRQQHGRGGGGHGQQRRQGGGGHGQQGGQGQQRRHGQHGSRPQHAHARSASAAASSASLGSKVTGFFKKLFGGKES
jgi:superfamily II DNA/RNA helicase